MNGAELDKELLLVENPARYSGGEFHWGRKDPSLCSFHAAICFPDLYEIGMSNHAVRILYDLMNRMDGVFCDRVFAVAPDYEAMLRRKNRRLSTLDERRPLKDLDFLGISIGYELCATNILQVLDLGGIAIRKDEREETDPIVICGGPASTNPLPFSLFTDFAYIGEAENGLARVISVIREMKAKGERRGAIIESLKQFDFLWYEGKERAVRAIDESFSLEEEKRFRYFVVPSFKVAQDNGVVEIMRGCPNGCRFCNAGQYYKPYRQRSRKTIEALVAQCVEDFGYREVTLSSLSSGDYPHLRNLIENLNARYMARHISFSLPSLKVSTFNLDVLEQLSEVRRSGLTFAIETPVKEWQKSVNKIVEVEKIIEIIQAAKQRGWKLAKFYFMVGLPFTDGEGEKEGIVTYLEKIWEATHISMNINVGTFIPKPHTPFQWVPQLTCEQSSELLVSLKKLLNERIRGIKVSYHEPFISTLEGLISRGDTRFGEVILASYKLGSRLDAWGDHMRRDFWTKAIEEAPYDVMESSNEGFPLDGKLPWDSISLRVSKEYLKKEYRKAERRELTGPCATDCDHACGVCSSHYGVQDKGDEVPEREERREAENLPVYQVLFSYRREGRSIFISHINAMRNWEMAFQRSGLLIQFSRGFNPKPRLEFVNPLSVGVRGEEEILLAELAIGKGTTDTEILTRLQASLTEGYTLTKVMILKNDEKTGRKVSLAKYMKGSLFLIDTKGRAEYEKILSSSQLARRCGDSLFEVRTRGETNLVKTIFGSEADKFKIAAEIDITRTRIYAGTDEGDYFSFLREKVGEVK